MQRACAWKPEPVAGGGASAHRQVRRDGEGLCGEAGSQERERRTPVRGCMVAAATGRERMTGDRAPISRVRLRRGLRYLRDVVLPAPGRLRIRDAAAQLVQGRAGASARHEFTSGPCPSTQLRRVPARAQHAAASPSLFGASGTQAPSTWALATSIRRGSIGSNACARQGLQP